MNTKTLIAIIIAMLMVISGVTILFSGFQANHDASQSSPSITTDTHSNQAALAPSTSQTTAGASQALAERNHVLSLAKSQNIPTKYMYLPNFMSKTSITGGHVTPGYDSSPAPMGIGDYGLYNNSGSIDTYNYTTSSFEAQVNLSSLNDFYMLDNFPTSVSIQLNAVMTNVALFGNSSYQMWTQDVAFFSPRTMTIQFLDNVWNFSSYGALLPYSTINYSSAEALGMGATIPSVGYHYGYSQIINVTFPLVFNLYMNTTLNNSRTTVYYNYSLPTMSMHGTYDEVIFNSTYGQSPGYSAPPPHYTVSGTQLSNYSIPGVFGIPLDSEIMIGGPGGGSTATIYGINGTMNLKFYNGTSSSYQDIRAAYDIGSETGETSVGIDVSSVGSTAYLNPGPSLVYGLWNLTTSQTSYSVTSNPADAFIFVQNNATLAAENLWAWAPLPDSGVETFSLPTGSYAYQAMLNDYDIASGTLTASTGITLTSDAAKGIYTPIIASSNAELAIIVSQLGGSGSGTSASPYYINAGSSMINPIFGSMNDYSFPAFPGILLRNVTSHLFINGTSLPITYTGANAQIIEYFESSIGTPDPLFLNNSLSVQIYQSSNITMENSNTYVMPTWYTFEIGNYFYVGQYNIWNSTNINITNNSFVSLGATIMMYNAPYQPGNNYITDNLFEGYSYLSNISPTFNASYILMANFVANFQQQFGVYLMSGGNYIYSNVFLTQITAYDSEYNYWEGTSYFYTNTWDNPLGREVFTLFGEEVSGAGNWYWDHNPLLDYFVGEAFSADYDPLFLTTGSNVVFYGTGSPALTVVSLQGLVIGGYSESMISYFNWPSTPPGYSLQYFVNYTTPGGYVTQTGEVVTVSNATEVVEINVYSVTFTETGLASSTNWTVSFDGMTENSTSATITFNGVANGSYTYYVHGVAGYNTVTSGGTLAVSGDTSQPVTFTTVSFSLSFTEIGLTSGTNWTVTVNGNEHSSNTSTIVVSGLTQGIYAYSIGNVSGYVNSASAGSIDIAGSSSVTVVFTPTPSSSTSSTILYEYLGVGAVVGLIIGGLAIFFVRKPPIAQP